MHDRLKAITKTAEKKRERNKGREGIVIKVTIEKTVFKDK